MDKYILAKPLHEAFNSPMAVERLFSYQYNWETNIIEYKGLLIVSVEEVNAYVIKSYMNYDNNYFKYIGTRESVDKCKDLCNNLKTIRDGFKRV